LARPAFSSTASSSARRLWSSSSEGSGIERLVRDLVDDPARSAAFSIWGPLLEGTPELALEEFYWEAGKPDKTPRAQR
jgi:hypothetical protein